MADEECNGNRKDIDEDQRTSSFSDDSEEDLIFQLDSSPSNGFEYPLPQTQPQSPQTQPTSPYQLLDTTPSISTAIVSWGISTRRVKSDVIPAQYPWATTQRAHLRTLNDMLSSGVRTIIGTVECDLSWIHTQDLEFDLEREFNQVASFVAANKSTMFDRVPDIWLYPPRSCPKCEGVSFVRPIISTKKRSINWLFLLLGQMIGYCSSEQLKYFCKHTNTPHAGGRDELICLTYLGLCKQLDPSGLFDNS
ncbi:hypothetical protein HHK36_002461 [Tetracentron sinense]|uniref:DUF7086 domain-containing protein n=1 Tax=Tetracentron sinense TaxID=13715 RepID=A0A834ZWG7_TETSI|nr:hypothetical protein HHK36_002461 [Tetracentron sinense]